MSTKVGEAWRICSHEPSQPRPLDAATPPGATLLGTATPPRDCHTFLDCHAPWGPPRPRATPPWGLAYLLLDLGLRPRLCAQQSLLLQLFLQLRLLFPESVCRRSRLTTRGPENATSSSPRSLRPRRRSVPPPCWVRAWLWPWLLGRAWLGAHLPSEAQVPGFPSLVTDVSPPLKAQAPARSVVPSPPVCT